jgi:hypothetical protein
MQYFKLLRAQSVSSVCMCAIKYVIIYIYKDVLHF